MDHHPQPPPFSPPTASSSSSSSIPTSPYHSSPSAPVPTATSPHEAEATQSLDIESTLDAHQLNQDSTVELSRPIRSSPASHHLNHDNHLVLPTSTRISPAAHGRRKRRYTSAEKHLVNGVRKISACRQCRKKRIKCEHARAFLRWVESKKNRNEDRVQPNDASLQSSSFHQTTDSAYWSSEEGKILHGYATDLGDAGNPVQWNSKKFTPVSLNGKELTLEDTQPNANRVAEHWLFNNEGQFVPPQTEVGSYKPTTVESSSEQYSQYPLPFGRPHSVAPHPPSNPKSQSLQPNHHPFSKNSCIISGLPLTLEKDVTPYLPTGNEPPIEVHVNSTVPGMSVFRYKKNPFRGQPGVGQAHQNPPPTPHSNPEDSSTSFTPDDQRRPSVSLLSPLNQLSLRDVPEHQVSQPEVQNNRLPASHIQGPIASRDTTPAFYPTNQNQDPALPPPDSFAEAHGFFPEYEASLAPLEYYTSMHQHPVQQQAGYQEPMHQQPMHQHQQPPPQQPMYQQPTHLQPMHLQPMYQETMYQEPLYQEPVYQESVHQEPVYQESVYQQPIYQESMLQQPMYQESMYQESMHQQSMDYDFTSGAFPADDVASGYAGMNNSHDTQQDSMLMMAGYEQHMPYSPHALTSDLKYPSHNGWSYPSNSSFTPTFTNDTPDTGSSAPIFSSHHNHAWQPSQHISGPDPTLLLRGLELPSTGEDYDRIWRDPHAANDGMDEMSVEEFSNLSEEAMREHLDRNMMNYDGTIR